MPKKIVYIAHPVNGDVKNNIDKILRICREIHLENNNIIPFAPYIVSLQYLDDNDPGERNLGINSGEEYFKRHAFDELWVYGEKISQGMKTEIEWAKKYNIPIFFKP